VNRLLEPGPIEPIATTPARRKRASARPRAGRKPDRYRRALTIALGVFIPLMSVATSKIAGTLAGHGHYALAAFGALIGVAVLAVSPSHLAWAVRDVTGSGPRASWALAVALDCGIVLCELVHVAAGGAGLALVCWAVLVVVAGFSMVLNCHAFLHHRAA
jgi:hypothetical protein